MLRQQGLVLKVRLLLLEQQQPQQAGQMGTQGNKLVGVFRVEHTAGVQMVA
jgi:hypothetical protein